MRRSRAKFVAAFVAALACTVFTSATSWAVYRSVIGPKLCCKTSCPHKKAAPSPERCCQMHPMAKAQGGQTSASTALTGALLAVEAVPIAFEASRDGLSAVLPPDGRSPPRPSLFAQHTSLLR